MYSHQPTLTSDLLFDRYPAGALRSVCGGVLAIADPGVEAMNPWLWTVPVALLAIVVVLWHFYGLGREIRAARARESFRLQHEHLETIVLERASASGIPRGLRWLACRFSSETEFAKERKTGRIVALVAVTVEFQAIEGSDMEGLPAVSLPRQGCAVLQFAHGEWTTTGRVLFNLSPSQVVEKFAHDYTRLAPVHS
jgi:hypothetical protein